jgi:hypothetical protein
MTEPEPDLAEVTTHRITAVPIVRGNAHASVRRVAPTCRFSAAPAL